jgi:hypothetical protein
MKSRNAVTKLNRESDRANRWQRQDFCLPADHGQNSWLIIGLIRQESVKRALAIISESSYLSERQVS